MSLLDFDSLERLDAAAFRARRPYPWVNPIGLLSPGGFRALRDSLPDAALFERSFGERRRYGQASHDRYLLRDRPGLAVAAPWREFLGELRGPRYRRFLEGMLGTRRFELRFEWHYAPRGCSVSPHCDARWKLGSHLFYFNTSEDWDPSWGGETVILDDEGRFARSSAPRFEEFTRAIRAEALGNASLLFARRGNSWHGVPELRCPEGALRKVFLVIVRRTWIPPLVAAETTALASKRAVG